MKLEQLDKLNEAASKLHCVLQLEINECLSAGLKRSL